MELLAPAGSPEALRAAVQNGAMAVYLGGGDFNARRTARNFDGEALAAAVSYCHLRGVRVYLTLNTLIGDRELPAALRLACEANDLGIDAVLVQDLGLLRLLQQTLPDLPLHASTQMGIHNAAGVRFCADLGLSRAVLARELSREDIEACAKASLETECFGHGALCMSHSGQCYFSALLGGRSGNRGLCAQPCRLAYRGAKVPYPLSLKDLSLAGHLDELSALGVCCLKLEGRKKRPEYVALVTETYAVALREGKAPGAGAIERLKALFSRSGFTDGYFTQSPASMLGRRAEGEAPPEALLRAARESYEGPERRPVPLHLTVTLLPGTPARLTLRDGDGHEATVCGPIPAPARAKPLTRLAVETQLSKLGGTVFSLNTLDIRLEEGLSLPLSALNALRREGLASMEALRTAPPSRRSLPWAGIGESLPPTPENGGLHLRLHHFSQLSDALLRQEPARVWLPLEEAAAHLDGLNALRTRYPGIRFGLRLPRAVFDRQWENFANALAHCRSGGLQDALLGNWGLIEAAQKAGFALHGDYGLGLFNSLTMKALKDLGFASATASFELNLAQISALRGPLPLGFLAYGRLPLMLLERGPRQCSALKDRRGATFPLLPHWGGRMELLNAKTLWLADKALPPHLARELYFTTESATRCATVLSAYRGLAPLTPPEDVTRGLYFRKVT